MIIEQIAKLISRLPPEGLAVLGKLVRTLLTSPDPLEATKRAAMAAASKAASDKIIAEGLRRRAR